MEINWVTFRAPATRSPRWSRLTWNSCTPSCSTDQERYQHLDDFEMSQHRDREWKLSQWEGTLMIDLISFSYLLHYYLLRLLSKSRQSQRRLCFWSLYFNTFRECSVFNCAVNKITKYKTVKWRIIIFMSNYCVFFHKIATIKKNLRLFNGFPFDADSEQYTKKREKLLK